MPLAIKDIPFFHELSSSELDAISACLIEKKFKKGEVVHREGGECTSLFFIKAGRVKVFRTSNQGKEQIYEVLGPGDTCACNPGEAVWKCASSAEVLDDSTLWFVAREQYVRMVKNNSKLMHALNDLFAKRLQCFGDIIEEVTLKDSKKRLVKFLLDMLAHKKITSPKNDILFIESTREEIAQRLGTARETIARQISILKRKKLIDVKPYQIIILDQKGLEKLLA